MLVGNKVGISLFIYLNSNLNFINRCDRQMSPTELQLKLQSTRYSTNNDIDKYRGDVNKDKYSTFQF